MPEGLGLPGHSPIGHAPLALMPAASPHSAPPAHGSNPLHEHFSHLAECFDQTAFAHQAHDFAGGCGHHGHAALADLEAKLKDALNELALLKQQVAHLAGETSPSKENSAAEKEIQQLKEKMALMEQKEALNEEIDAHKTYAEFRKQGRDIAMKLI